MSSFDGVGFGVGNSGVGTANTSNPRIGPQLNELLKRYGLQSLTGWLSRAVINGWSEEQIILELYQRPEFKERFPAIFGRENLNLPPISIEDYLQYEMTAHQLGSMWGLRLTQAEINKLIERDVSATELEQRFNIVASAVYESDAETKAALGDFFGIDQNGLFRYWMDPMKQLGTLQAQYRMGEIAGAAMRSGYGGITQGQAQRLQEAGLDREAAAQGFGALAGMEELFSPLYGGERLITTDEQIEILAGDEDVAAEVEERAQRRKQEFQGSGSYAAGETGFATGTAEES